jgi:CheY-like chemotaxis protein
MQQVAMNLLVNAAEALPTTGGTVRVTTGLAAAADPGLTATGVPPSYPHVFVEIADDGAGMSSEVQARIFEPFFTTKATGHGLGLAAVKNILRAHNGIIRLTSAPGAGTTFRMYLPAYQPARPPERGLTPAPPVAPTGEVLIVDDEPFVRDIVARMLQKAGYASRTAGTGAEALTVVREHPSIVLAVIDLRMPGMDGMTTLRQLGEIRPDLKAILTSGCSSDELPQHDDPRLIGFLPKPYVFDQLLKMVQQGFASLARL